MQRKIFDFHPQNAVMWGWPERYCPKCKTRRYLEIGAKTFRCVECGEPIPIQLKKRRQNNMNRKEFFEQINGLGFISTNEIPRISRAYWLAKEVHRTQKRDGGERYFEHCRRVAILQMEAGGIIAALFDRIADGIVAALLHDCVEDGFIPEDILAQFFGCRIANAIDVLSKVTPVFGKDTGAVKEKIKKDPETYWQTIAKAPAWIRRVKLADRLDNINAMVAWPEKRQRKYIIETEKYILPIADRTDPRLAEAIRNECKKYTS